MATIKQTQVFKEVVNGSSISKAMLKAGYSLSTSKRTNKVTKTQGWQELMKKYLPDKDLAIKHNEQLNSSKLSKLYFDIDDDDKVIESVCKKLGVELLYIKVNKAGDGKTANVKAPDFFFRDLALDKAYKLKARYEIPEGEANKVLIINLTGETAKRFNVIDIPPSSEGNSLGPAQV